MRRSTRRRWRRRTLGQELRVVVAGEQDPIGPLAGQPDDQIHHLDRALGVCATNGCSWTVRPIARDLARDVRARLPDGRRARRAAGRSPTIWRRCSQALLLSNTALVVARRRGCDRLGGLRLRISGQQSVADAHIRGTAPDMHERTIARFIRDSAEGLGHYGIDSAVALDFRSLTKP